MSKPIFINVSIENDNFVPEISRYILGLIPGNITHITEADYGATERMNIARIEHYGNAIIIFSIGDNK